VKRTLTFTDDSTGNGKPVSSTRSFGRYVKYFPSFLLKIIVGEAPKIRSSVEELLETIDALGSGEELESIKESLEQVKKGETRSWDEYVDELRKKGEI